MMLRKIFKLLFAVITCIFIHAQCSAASAVVVFAPESYYMNPRFYEITRNIITKYSQRIIMGPEIDEAFAEYAAEHATYRLDLLPEFAEEYDCDYWIRIFVCNPHFWDATHINAHTGRHTALATCAVDVGALIMNPERTVQTGEGAALFADYGDFHNLAVVSEDELICRSFQRGMEAVFESIGWRIKE